MYRKSCCTTPRVGVGRAVGTGGSISTLLKFYVKVSYVVGNALSGELSYMQTGIVLFLVWQRGHFYKKRNSVWNP